MASEGDERMKGMDHPVHPVHPFHVVSFLLTNWIVMSIKIKLLKRQMNT